MSITLKLDEKALETLLSSSGEEIKLELQRCVIENYANKHIKALGSMSVIQKALEDTRRDVLVEVRKYLEKQNLSWQGKELTEQSKQLIVNATKSAINAEVIENCSALRKEIKNNINEYIMDIFNREIKRSIDSEIKKLFLTDEYLQAIIKNKAMEIIKEKLA